MIHDERDVLERLFDEVADLPSPEREARLAEAGLRHPEVVAEVRRLLRLDTGSGAPDALFSHVRGAMDKAAVRFDRYVLLAPIGEGATGVVYAAEQQEPVRRLVAIKVLKPGMDSATILRRIEFERKALSMLDHPNVAALLDAGMTADGRPYVVMPLVHGLPITDFCESEGLPVVDRVGAFVQACLGVRHAHQRGIIHRDLKPANILAAGTRAGPLVRVIDFGIAKAITDPAPGEVVVTEFGHGVGTRGYVSPEQAAGKGGAVDVRTDVYSLGAVLYELIAGVPAIPAAAMQGLSGEALATAIADARPAPPSRVAAAAGKSGVPKALAADLDQIAAKCLAIDPAERYADVGQLLDDLDRWVKGDPVRAAPSSAVYRGRKFLRKHRVATAAACMALASILAGGTAAVWFGVQAGRESQNARNWFGVAQARLPEASMLELARDVWGFYKPGSPDDRAVQAYAQGASLLGQLQEERALPHLREALDHTVAANSPEPERLVRVQIARALLAQERPDEAAAELDRVPPESSHAASRRVSLLSRITCAWITASKGDHAEALRLAKTLEAEADDVFGPAHNETIRLTIFRARQLSALGLHDEATALASWLPPLLEQRGGVSPTMQLEARLADAETLLDAGRAGEALDGLLPLLNDYLSAAVPDQMGSLACRATLARAFLETGDVQLALENLNFVLEQESGRYTARNRRVERRMWEIRDILVHSRRFADLTGFLGEWHDRRKQAGAAQPDVPMCQAMHDAAISSGDWVTARLWEVWMNQKGSPQRPASRDYLFKRQDSVMGQTTPSAG